MPNYRRRYGEGGTFAFVVCLRDRRRTTFTDEIDVIKRAYADTVRARPVHTLALCVLPDHIHAVWTLPEGDTDYSGRWRSFKLRATHALGRRIWQRGFYEHTVRDDADLNNQVNYAHWNPVKHGYVSDMDDWPHSTWHRWKREHGRAWTPPPEDMHLS